MDEVYDDTDDCDDGKSGITQADLDQLIHIIGERLEAAVQAMVERAEIFEKTVTSLEQQVAALAFGFGESTVLLEALLGQLAFASPEAQEAFHESHKQRRKAFLEIIQNSADAMAKQDPTAAQTLADMAAEQLTDFNEE